MRFMSRFTLVAVLALAFLAAPIGALCSSCCPESDSGERLGKTMPCCGEDCGPTVATAQPSAPAVVAARATLDQRAVAVTTIPVWHGPASPEGAAFVFVAASPPSGSGPPSSVLRL
jgi:hypothetical protein